MLGSVGVGGALAYHGARVASRWVAEVAARVAAAAMQQLLTGWILQWALQAGVQYLLTADVLGALVRSLPSPLAWATAPGAAASSPPPWGDDRSEVMRWSNLAPVRWDEVAGDGSVVGTALALGAGAFGLSRRLR